MWKVLVAEDDEKTAQSIVKSLKGLARCRAARDGEEALTLFRKSRKGKRPFDFILLDVTMPKMDGFDVLRAIRAEDPDETRVIMITAFRDSLMTHYNIGWDDFITKPVDPALLIEHMRTLKDS